MDFDTLAAECAPGVAPQTLAAIVRTESGFKPLVIGINGSAKLQRQPVTKDEAVVTAKWLVANGYNIDMGLGQVNSANLIKLGLGIEDLFDPCKNLAASANILQGNYLSASRQTPDAQMALHAALSAYNTGSFTKGFSNGYVQKVIRNAIGDSATPIPLVKSTDVANRSVVHTKVPSRPKNSIAEAASPLVVDAGDKVVSASARDQSPSDVMVFH